MSIKTEVRKVIKRIEKGWARNSLFRDKANKDLCVYQTLDSLMSSFHEPSRINKIKSKITNCCLEGACFFTKEPFKVANYIKDKLRQNGYNKELFEFNDSFNDKRTMLRKLKKILSN